MSWMRRFTYLAVLYSFFEYRGTNGTRGKCVCTYKNSVYNLAPLQGKHGRPSLETSHADGDGFMYSYSPCTSFTLVRCIDTAVCMWDSNGSSASYENIGNQSTATCHTDSDTGTPQLVYKNVLGKEWYARVTLICNWTTTTASFEKVPGSAYKFHLTHICACADGCPVDPVTTKRTPGTTYPKSTPGTTKPTKTPAPTGQDDWKQIWEPVTIAAGSVVSVIFVIVVIWIIIPRLRGQHVENNQNNQNNPDERQHLIREGDSGIDESRNSFPDSNDGRRSANLRHVSPPVSMSSCSDITVPNKDDFNKTGGVSVPV